MKITSISVQVKNPNRVNVSVDGKYRLSLDIYQLTELGVKAGQEIDDATLAELESASQFGKLYARTLEYCLMRPRSQKEVKDYLYKKTLKTRYKSRTGGEIKERDGVDRSITSMVFDRLTAKGYVDDEKFARFWVENRNQRKGSSVRKLRNELLIKGVANSLIDAVFSDGVRSDEEEIRKIITKKLAKYPDDTKLMQYLVRQGFGYDLVKTEIRLARDSD